MPRSSSSLTNAGQAAARDLLDGGIRAGTNIDDPLDPAFADAFVRALADGLKRRFRGVAGDVVEGAGRVVRSSNVEREHGLIEVLQNADDLGATQVRFQLAGGDADGRWLRIVHNGDRVLAPHVLAMTLALITTKTEDEHATGKFGVGLKTLARMADSFSVQSWPYAFEVNNQRLRPAERTAKVDGIYDPARLETLLTLHLQPNYPVEAFEAWFEAFEPEALLFLRSVRELVWLDEAGQVSAERALEEVERKALTLEVGGSDVAADEVELRDGTTGRSWTRVTHNESVPKGLARTDKATPASTPVGLAFASDRAMGRFYAGLPLAIPAKLPFSVNAQFDTETSRTNLLQDEGWNEWLLGRAGALATALANHRLATAPATGWALVPLSEAVKDVADAWLHERLMEMVDSTHTQLRDHALLPLGVGIPLDGVSFEVAELDELLSAEDLDALAPDWTPLPRDMRDGEDRWRAVLAELDVGHAVEVEVAVELFEWSDEELRARKGEWFVRLVGAGLDGALGDRLERLRCLLLADGQRLSPADAAQGLVLSQDPDGDPLGRRLGLIRPLDSAFYGANSPATEVMEWLRRDVDVRTSTTPADTLRGLAKWPSEHAIELDEDAVRALMRAFNSAPSLAEELGSEIGKAVLLRGTTWVRDRQVSRLVRPAEAYLRRTSWARAAAKTEGLLWLDSRYARLLRPRGGSRLGGDDGHGKARGGRGRAADTESDQIRRFFEQLGAETAPRIEPRPTNDSRDGQRAAKLRRAQLTDSQLAALDPNQPFSGLMGDHLSPDLQAVLENIAGGRVRAGHERAHHLLRAMERSWKRLYAGHEEADAVHAYYQMNRMGEVPATWCALAAQTAWMTNERGHWREPRQLAIKTPAFEAFLGAAPHKFAFGLDARQGSLPIVRALGFEAEPQAGTLLDRLEELQTQELSGKRVNAAAVEHCYAALAAISPDPNARGRARRMGDETINSVRRRLGRRKLLRIDGEWVAPKGVFVGKPIFHRHGRFVTETAERLWCLLELRRPNLRDCIAVLEHIARTGPPEGEAPVLIETYRYMDAELEAGAAVPRALAQLPLWTTAGWCSERRVYAVRDRTLQEGIGKYVPVWLAPVPVDSVRALLAALDVTLLDDAAFQPLGVNSGSRSAGSQFDPFLRATARHFQEWLAVEDGALYEGIANGIGWDALSSAKVALNARLLVDVALPDYGRMPVPCRAHLQVGRDVTVAVAGKDAIEDGDLMAGVIGSTIGAVGPDWHVLAHGWSQAVARTRADEQPRGLRLSEDIAAAAEAEQAPASSSEVGRETKPGSLAAAQKPEVGNSGRAGQLAPGDTEPAPIRSLKDIEEIVARVEIVDGPRSGEEALEIQTPASAPDALVAPRKGKRVSVGSTSRGPRRPRSDPDRETRGLQVVAREAQRLWGAQLTDVRDQGNVGADATDQQGRFYELKAHSRAIPAEISLEPSQFERAKREGENCILSVVGGLEEGHETVVKLIPDPLRRLPWRTTSDIVVGGLHQVGQDAASSNSAAAASQ